MKSAGLAWGRKITPTMRNEVCRISEFLGINPSWLMACMAFETGGTFSPGVLNKAGSGATGLIQFMPVTALTLGTTTAELAKMSFVGQLQYVLRYFAPIASKLKTLEDVYMAILWPAAVGKPNNYILFRKDDPKHPKRYVQNAGLDWNKDGVITKAEACAKVQMLLLEGMKPGNAA